MGPLSTVRGRGVAMDASGVRSFNAPARSARLGARVIALPQAAGPALGTLVSPRARQWASEVSATLCVVGGFLAAPLLTILAFVGLLMPGHFILHRAATTLLLVAVVWLGLALVGAHMHHSRHEHVERAEQ